MGTGVGRNSLTVCVDSGMTIGAKPSWSTTGVVVVWISLPGKNIWNVFHAANIINTLPIERNTHFLYRVKNFLIEHLFFILYAYIIFYAYAVY